jgi:hypothetical protein
MAYSVLPLPLRLITGLRTGAARAYRQPRSPGHPCPNHVQGRDRARRSRLR